MKMRIVEHRHIGWL